MNPNEHNSRRAIRFSFIGVFVLVVGVLAAIYNREILEHLGLRRESNTVSQSSVVESSIINATDSYETPVSADSEGIELPPIYDPDKPAFDLTKRGSDVCPVHKIQMPAKVVQIQFSFDTRWVSEFDKRKETEFPFAYAFVHDTYVSPIDHPDFGMRFCGTGLPPPTFAKMFVCPKCLAAYESAVRAFNTKVAATFEAQRAEKARQTILPSTQKR